MTIRTLTVLNTLCAWICLAAPTVAREAILPPAFGSHSFAFHVPDTVAPFSTGARVEFFSVDDQSVPRRLNIYGFVLGTRDSVAFVELSERDAVRIIQTKQSHTVKVTKIADPDPGFVADRRALAAETVAVQVAPHMRTLTFQADLPAEEVATWQRGDILVLTGEGTTTEGRVVVGQYYKRGDITGRFSSAVVSDDGRVEIELVADPVDAHEILAAEVKGPVQIVNKGRAQKPEVRERQRCYIRHRRAETISTIEIPCADD